MEERVVPIRTFLRDHESEIADEWVGAVSRLRGEAGAAHDRLAGLLEAMADIVDDIARGQSLDETFAAARCKSIGELEVAHVVPELSALRGCLIGLWQRRRAEWSALELHAVHVAIDALIAACVSRADEALRAERERVLGKLEALLAASPIGIAFLDLELRYVRINESLAALNGRPVAEHIGRSVDEIIPQATDVLVPVLRAVIATGAPVLNRATTVGERTFLSTFFPVRSSGGEIVGVGGIVSDVTDVRRTEEELRRAEARMQSVLDNTPAQVWIKDPDGRIVYANHHLAEALGRPFEEVVGRRSEDLLPPAIAAEHAAHDEIVRRENRAVKAEESVPGPDGTRTFLSIKFPLPGDPPMVGGIATEITERKRIEQDLRLAIRSREDVLAVVSHDLRNPLGTIQLSSAMLLSKLGDDQRWRRHLEIIHHSCLRMDHLISDLLDMASIGAGRLSIEKHPEPAADVLREAADVHQPRARERAVTLTSDDSGLASVVVECDRHRIMQVFENLIGNALKFSRAGDAIALDAEVNAECVSFHVRDTGPGIPPAVVGHLFDPYWSEKPGRSGVGLGLYIARGIVERHGGKISVDSEPGRGTVFTFSIPRAT
jgi:PAS domain S-box-containing protein